ncbi:hydrogen peroxide-inducible genes activator [Thalassotalea mangrovi]|uniref:Hydrogen peroxide-inducible genes activator n=1 Tax=Thalassotalea mangrovi TaxID=2572245 RepID=A0A4U1B1T4_9GAMM|nr:hydrogen peroxide-inducible genes activator [Thalassotalea mangrovi]TKB43187.1 hydrogen peroxide-inducible genes activator [Thalassotalea mangrovi]
MNTHLPNLKHLQYLVALHHHQHFHKAAESCFVSQSTLSSAIIKLEQLLNCQLIERDHKNFVFTRHGKEVVAMAEQLLNQADDLINYCQVQGNPAQGKIYLGCIPTIAPFLMTEVIERAHQSYPGLDMFVIEDTTENLLDALQHGRIDVAVLALPIDDKFSQGFHYLPLGKDGFYLAGSRALIDKVLADGDYRHVSKGQIFVLSEEHCLTRHALAVCKVNEKEKLNDFAPTSLTTLMQMTLHHKGLTFLPHMAIKRGLAGYADIAYAPLPGHPSREIALVYRHRSYRQETYENLAKIIKPLI